MAWGISTGNAVGRGFDAAGLCGLIMAWAALPQASHGPAWVIIDDQSALGTDPYIIIADRSLPWTHSAWPKIIRIVLPTAVPGFIQFTSYYTWDPSTHTGVVHFYSYIHTLDSAGFPYWLRGGEDGLHIAAWPGGDTAPSFGMIDAFDGDANELEAQTHSGTAVSPLYLESGDGGGLISGWHNLVGLSATTTDANGNIHLSIINTTGVTFRLDIFRDAARTERVAFSSTFTNAATGAKSFTADTTYSAGLTGNLTTNATVSANTSISCRCLRMALGSGEGANITVNKPYYIIDFSGNTVRVSYSIVTAKVGDIIQLDGIRSGLDFSAGSFISPYPFRWYCMGDRGFQTGQNKVITLTLQSLRGHETNTSFDQSRWRSQIAYDTNGVELSSPDDEAIYRISRGSLRELYNNTANNTNTGMNRIYGRPRNMVYGSASLVTIMSNGRRSAGVDYLAFSVSGLGYQMIRDTEST